MISNQQRFSISHPPNDSTSKQKSNSSSQQPKTSIFHSQINLPSNEENNSPSNNQGEFSIEQKNILHPTQKKFSFVSKEKSLFDELRNESLCEKPIIKLQDLQSNASTTLIEPNLDLETNTYLQPKMQLDASKSLDLKMGISSENKVNKKDFKLPISLSLEKIDNQNQSESSYRLQEYPSKSFHSYKQNFYKLPHPKWIQKLIIIPAQRNGYHNITSVVKIYCDEQLYISYIGLTLFYNM